MPSKGLSKRKNFSVGCDNFEALFPSNPVISQSEWVKKTDYQKDIAASSTWDSLTDWRNWYESEGRREFQSKIDAIPGVKTTDQSY
jgi:hypothetical protein